MSTPQGEIYTSETFFEDQGTPFDPSTVLVDVFDATGAQLVTGDVPTRLEVGHYQYLYLVPPDGALGDWRIHWHFEDDSAALEFDELFEVVLGTVLVLAGDWEALVVAYLKARGEVAELSTGGGTELRPGATFPRWRLQRVGGIPDFPGWVAHPRFQIEAWGGTKTQANQLATVLEGAILEMPAQHHDLGVVTDTTLELSQLWSPDPQTARPRYISSFRMTCHPNMAA
jgi:hypothetical protein